QVLGDCRNSIGWNDIAQEGLARAWSAGTIGRCGVVDGYRQLTEIAVPHLQSGQRYKARGLFDLVAPTCVGSKEEDAVLFDGSAESKPKLVLVLHSTLVGKEAPRIQRRVAEVLID